MVGSFENFFAISWIYLPASIVAGQVVYESGPDSDPLATRLTREIFVNFMKTFGGCGYRPSCSCRGEKCMVAYILDPLAQKFHDHFCKPPRVIYTRYAYNTRLDFPAVS